MKLQFDPHWLRPTGKLIKCIYEQQRWVKQAFKQYTAIDKVQQRQ